MQVLECMVCKEEVQLQSFVTVGEKITCPVCFQQYKVISTTPFNVQFRGIQMDAAWGNPEKLARLRRMERKSREIVDIDDERSEEEFPYHSRATSRYAGKRTHRQKRVRVYEYDE